ncbi:HIRAN domain-containing protein [Acinetobacter calcoaceticus]|uniref:HIRAN domain-containing protein n=1 Tax=Acinetobacter calcoaceticus TaxID=471 RepID=A0A4R1Y3Z9_ACICA|nr:HIRAN domain-containing protein [Acinetobacter calcoaceticus]
MKSVFVMWQDLANTRMWHPVAKLTQRSEDNYIFNYTQGSMHEYFTFFPSMEDKTKVYQSDRLFTFFKNRLIPESRPEHDSMFKWSGLSTDSKDYLELLSISGGERKTDHFRIVNIPKQQDGLYKIQFFVSSINYLSRDERDHLTHLKSGDKLNYQFDAGNEADNNATILLKEASIKVGYLPHYLCKDLKNLVAYDQSNEIEFSVVKVNLDAPAQFRVLCELKAAWPDGFVPFDDREFDSI